MVSCSEYDYFEIACMNRYPIRLELKDGGTVEGVALDVKISEARTECLKMRVADDEQLVELESIAKLNVLIENPHFMSVGFS